MDGLTVKPDAAPEVEADPVAAAVYTRIDTELAQMEGRMRTERRRLTILLERIEAMRSLTEPHRGGRRAGDALLALRGRMAQDALREVMDAVAAWRTCQVRSWNVGQVGPFEALSRVEDVAREALGLPPRDSANRKGESRDPR